jgi:hypothetical protein
MKFRPAPWRRLSIWLLVALLLGGSSSAAAQNQSATLALLGLASKDGDDEAAAELTEALRAEVGADSELTLSDSSASLAQLVVLTDCDIAAAACRDVIARRLDVHELIYGSIRRTELGHAVELHRYSSVDGSVSHASRELTIEGASETELASDARGLLRELRASEEPEAPTPEPAPVLTRERRSVPQAPLDPAPEKPVAQDEPSSNDWLGYSLLGVAAVSVGLVAFSWNEIDAARSDADFHAYRKAIGQSSQGDVDDVCAEADAGETYGLGERLKEVRSACARGVTFEILQWVFVGSALVSGGLGIYLLLDADGEPDSARASLVPVLGKDQAGLQLRMKL